MKHPRIRSLLLCAFVSCLFSACGGGGSSSQSSTPSTPPPATNPPPQPPAALTVAYTATGTLTVGTPYTGATPALENAEAGATPVFTVTKGTLPNGLNLDAATGRISGVPIQFTDFSVEVKAVTGSKSATTTVSGKVESPLGIANVISVPSVEAFRLQNPTANYYVDSVNGNDLADGKTASTPWKSLSKVNALTLKPGTIVSLARGSVWKEQLRLRDAGTAAAPIVVQPYGSGAAPTIQLFTSENDGTNGVLVTGSYIHVLELRLSDIHWSAIHLDKNSQHVVVAGNEILRCGMGIDVLGKHQRALSNYIHDMTMVVDTGDANTAWGANGMGIQGEDLEIAFNRFVNCRAQCKNFGGWDGGAIEYFGYADGVGWNQITTDVHIHHNFVDACDGFIEANGRIKGLVIAYNLFINIPSGVFLFHMRTNTENGVAIKNTYEARMENNTLIGALTPFAFWNPDSYVAGGNQFVIRNNIAVTQSHVGWDLACVGADLVHDHNLFSFLTGGSLGFSQHLWTLTSTERIADPGFVDLNKKDYRLGASSPALKQGSPASYEADLLGNRVPAGAASDIGAYQQ
jgi:hypothetical protein